MEPEIVFYYSNRSETRMVTNFQKLKLLRTFVLTDGVMESEDIILDQIGIVNSERGNFTLCMHAQIQTRIYRYACMMNILQGENSVYWKLTYFGVIHDKHVDVASWMTRAF